MKKALSLTIIIGLLSFIVAFALRSPVFAWSQSTHAYVAKKCLGIEHKYLLNYNARLGCIVPDFFWYLRDSKRIDQATAEKLHGNTTEPCVVPGDTTYFYEIAQGRLRPWQYLLKFFPEGIKTHVYADIIAHNRVNGYLEGPGMWVDTLLDKMDLAGEDRDAYREAAHLAIEFSVDALVVHDSGLQLADLFFCNRQAHLMEEAVWVALGHNPGFDVNVEFKKFLGLVRALEKATAFYAPYLISAGLDSGSVSDFDVEPLMEAQSELSEESLDLYTKVFMILLGHPEKIYETLTETGKHWEFKALKDTLDFWDSPCYQALQ
jgi:hypothetical protein